MKKIVQYLEEKITLVELIGIIAILAAIANVINSVMQLPSWFFEVISAA